MVWKRVYAWIMQWKVNYAAKVEITAYIEAGRVMNELKRMDTKLTARIDTLEQALDDVMEKYLRKITARENREKKKELVEENILTQNSFDMIRRRHE